MDYLKNFSLYLKLEKDLSDNTIENYIRDIKNFLKYVNYDIKSVTPTVIRSYVAHLTEKGKKRNTINRSLCSIKGFYKYLVDIEKAIDKSPAEEVHLVSREKSLPKALSKSDIIKILNTASQEDLKSRLIIELLYGLGGRVSEICALRVEDIDFEEHYIRIIGKGNKERHNPIHKGCVQLIKEYMKKYNITSGYLFPHRLNKDKHITREAIFLKVKNLADKAGIDRSLVSPHVFRHSFATHLLDNGCDMAIVQEYLGHEDISTTKIYAKITRGNKKNNFMKFHPLAQ